ncbi:uncharacterized protein LOC112525648 [Cynara cardunculus var. scolymus]|uniref:uncharacterized protein LOC112525648 n=1 Tax=Cynara cardunculus var. scolymus TaxID=59895 RepID=UPI000D624B1D|nr:uncharacterized protein LOC112525648 [Cynara cardunculus var. scolymus]
MDCSGERSEFKKMNYEEFEEERTKPCNLASEGEFTSNIPSTLDLNPKSNHLQAANEPCFLGKTKETEPTNSFGKQTSFGLDLNSQDVSSCIDHDPFHDALSECGSTCGSAGDKDSMRIWKQMKQNGFLSSSHGGVLVPPMPKPRGRKKGNASVIKKKIEMAKREQVSRFAKVAAPSGLLNELNPGIINHVRNRRQVHSIIENLVRSARNKKKNSEHKRDDGTVNHMSRSFCSSGGVTGDDDSSLMDRQVFARSKTSYHPANPNKECEDDGLELKLSSASTMASENMSSLSNEEPSNISTVDSLSIKAASVASQWLELIHQDIKGRLAALRRSKKRVRAVTQTELPFLISCDQENDPSNRANNDMHKFKWTALFHQMDKSLSEEEKHLEDSLNQVREMLLHCEHGLLQFPPPNGVAVQSKQIFQKAEPVLDKGLAVRAAAAAIYSTSNFLQSAENLPCF